MERKGDIMTPLKKKTTIFTGPFCPSVIDARSLVNILPKNLFFSRAAKKL